MNYFELFELPLAFDIDTAVLAERYRALQRAVHPDKFANDTEQQKRLSVQHTAQINDGFHTLKDPIRRAEHILSLRGTELSHETTTVKDSTFLMQQMEWHEALADITHSTDPHAEVDALYHSFAQYRTQLTTELSELLVTDTSQAQVVAADHVRKLKFMAKLHHELTRIEDALFD